MEASSVGATQSQDYAEMRNRPGRHPIALCKKNYEAEAPIKVNEAPHELTLDVVIEKLRNAEGRGGNGLTVGRSRCAPTLLHYPGAALRKYRAHLPLRIGGFIPVAAFDATFHVEAATGRIKSDAARFSSSELRWIGCLGGAVLGWSTTYALALPNCAVVFGVLAGARLCSGWLDRTFTPFINLVGRISGADDSGRLLWTGTARGFQHAPIGLIRNVLVMSNGFEYQTGDGFQHRYTRQDACGCEQTIEYQEPYSYGSETFVELTNFPLKLAARLGIALDLPL